ncbi:hypothetical protein SAMN04515647_3820 [Cohaesibacter sp. ES.047]|uniref:hypothetical protein n=1 Tax=Cohaesibacter sp. ES.047 TaxID=1798205 RepID=UPI000BB7CF1D|nr:hypothetical protein [Cohaesibacter sp. ES.047]SNY93521.1 hypothetical protein SAMN04515647_3820 [Cohaesibacter sp. ES.047]
MTNETTAQVRSVMDVNAKSVAMAVGHVAALALVTQMRDGGPEEQELYYRMFQSLEEGADTEADLEMMADYVCGRPENVSGEQLFRKAAELALHDAPASSYFEQSHEVREAYRLFAKACRLVFVDLEIWQREEQARLERVAQKRKPIPLEDQTYAPDEPPMVKDPVHAAALKAIAEMPKTKVDMGETEAGTQTPPPVVSEDLQSPMSIGERPVAHQGKPQRGGARNPKTNK